MRLWAVWDLEEKQAIAIHVSEGRSCFDAWLFLKKVARLCEGRKPRIFVDCGKWYPWAFERLGFRYSVMGFGPRSAIERFLSVIDWRIR
ncbi:MAG: hypothetical protein QMC98_01200, partial [Candidatus Thermoplasmatota archaeon]|nr:hypothetical protein [Candidatus Thermoplasmatota archaeon]